MDATMKILSQFPETKFEIDRVAMTIRNIVLEGEVDELKFWKQIMAMDKLVSVIKSDALIKDSVLEKAERYGQKSFDAYNASFRVQETGVKYDYLSCLDTEYEQICAEVDKWTTKKKEREDFLKTIRPDQTVFGADGVQLMPPAKTSTTSVVVVIK